MCAFHGKSSSTFGPFYSQDEVIFVVLSCCILEYCIFWVWEKREWKRDRLYVFLLEKEESIWWGCVYGCSKFVNCYTGCSSVVNSFFGEWLHGSVSYKTRGSHQGWFVRRGDLVKGRSLGQRGDGGRELEGVQSCISPRDLGWSFSSGSFYLGVAPQT